VQKIAIEILIEIVIEIVIEIGRNLKSEIGFCTLPLRRKS